MTKAIQISGKAVRLALAITQHTPSLSGFPRFWIRPDGVTFATDGFKLAHMPDTWTCDDWTWKPEDFVEMAVDGYGLPKTIAQNVETVYLTFDPEKWKSSPEISVHEVNATLRLQSLGKAADKLYEVTLTRRNAPDYTKLGILDEDAARSLRIPASKIRLNVINAYDIHKALDMMDREHPSLWMFTSEGGVHSRLCGHRVPEGWDIIMASPATREDS